MRYRYRRSGGGHRPVRPLRSPVSLCALPAALGDPGHDNAKSSALSQLGFQHHATAELLGDEVIDDMEAESRATFIAPGGKEWVKGLALHVGGHAGPVIGEDDLDIVSAARPRRDRDGAGTAVGEGVVGG